MCMYLLGFTWIFLDLRVFTSILVDLHAFTLVITSRGSEIKALIEFGK